MTSRSDCEPLPKPTLSPFVLARAGTFLCVGFFTAAVWCMPAVLCGVGAWRLHRGTVGSFSRNKQPVNHFNQKNYIIRLINLTRNARTQHACRELTTLPNKKRERHADAVAGGAGDSVDMV